MRPVERAMRMIGKRYGSRVCSGFTVEYYAPFHSKTVFIFLRCDCGRVSKVLLSIIECKGSKRLGCRACARYVQYGSLTEREAGEILKQIEQEERRGK